MVLQATRVDEVTAMKLNGHEVKDVDCYAQHPERYTSTFWLGFCLLGGYKFFVVLVILLLWLIL